MLKASDKVWVCGEGHVDDMHLDDGGVCLTCGGEGGRTVSCVEPDCCGNLNSAGECRGDCAVPVEVEDVEPCPECNGSRRATNLLCSRCGGTCEQFSLDGLAREYRERLRVNVGLITENTQLKRKIAGLETPDAKG